MKSQFERVKTCRQKSTPYHATEEIDRLLQAGHEVVIQGGEYVAHLVLTTLKDERFYLPYTDSKPYVYPQAQPTLQAALDTLESACQDAFAKMPPEPPRPRHSGPPVTSTDLTGSRRAPRPLIPPPPRRPSLFARLSDAVPTPPKSAPEPPLEPTTEPRPSDPRNTG